MSNTGGKTERHRPQTESSMTGIGCEYIYLYRSMTSRKRCRARKPLTIKEKATPEGSLRGAVAMCVFSIYGIGQDDSCKRCRTPVMLLYLYSVIAAGARANAADIRLFLYKLLQVFRVIL